MSEVFQQKKMRLKHFHPFDWKGPEVETGFENAEFSRAQRNLGIELGEAGQIAAAAERCQESPDSPG